jgi:hypothetical protein
MAGLRKWLRTHVRSALRKLGGKSRQPKQQESNNYVSARDLNISAPITVRHDGVTFAPSMAEPALFPSIQEIEEPREEQQHHRHGIIEVEVPDYADSTMELAMPNLSFTTLVEEVEAPPSLHEDSDTDTIPGDLMPITPSLSQRTSRRWSVIQGLGSLPGYPTMTIASRPQSYADSNVSTTRETNRSSFYSFTTRASSVRDSTSRPWSVIHGLSSLPGYPTMSIASRPQSCVNSNISTTREAKRLSFYSFTSRDGSIRKSNSRPRSIVNGLSSLSGYPTMNFTSRPQSYIDSERLETRQTNRSSVYSGIDGKNSSRSRRASMPNRRVLGPSKRGSWRGQPLSKRKSVMSDSSTYSGTSRRFSRWNWDLETYEIHTNPYAPV